MYEAQDSCLLVASDSDLIKLPIVKNQRLTDRKDEFINTGFEGICACLALFIVLK